MSNIRRMPGTWFCRLDGDLPEDGCVLADLMTWNNLKQCWEVADGQELLVHDCGLGALPDGSIVEFGYDVDADRFVALERPASGFSVERGDDGKLRWPQVTKAD